VTCKWVLFSAYYAYNFFFFLSFSVLGYVGITEMAMHACFAISGQQIFFFFGWIYGQQIWSMLLPYG